MTRSIVAFSAVTLIGIAFLAALYIFTPLWLAIGWTLCLLAAVALGYEAKSEREAPKQEEEGGVVVDLNAFRGFSEARKRPKGRAA